MSNLKSMTLAAAALGILAAAPLQAQFVSDKSPAAVTTVAELLKNGKQDQEASLEGFIVEQVKRKKYVFADETGRIIAEIPDKVFQGQRVDPKTKIRIAGEVEVEDAEDEGCDVYRVTGGKAADWARSGWEATGFLSENKYDAVLLDLGLPGKDGMSVLRELRAKDSETPVVILTARDGLDDRLAGLDAGADDYVVKPFHMSEVLARLRAIERRRQGAQAASKVLTNGTMTLNCETKTVRLHAPEGDKEVALSKREFDLMEALMTRPGAILSRTTLEERLYGDGDMPESNALEFIIHGLRKKLGANAIGNVRGLGWMVHKGRAAGR